MESMKKKLKDMFMLPLTEDELCKVRDKKPGPELRSPDL